MRKEDTFFNPLPRIPVVFVNDSSPSESPFMDELNSHGQKFCDRLSAHPDLKFQVELGILSFAHGVTVHQDLTSIEGGVKCPKFAVEGCGTRCDLAVDKAWSMIDSQVRGYRESGISHYDPWVIMMSDYCSGGSWQKSAKATQDRCNGGKGFFVGACVGHVDENAAKSYCTKELPPFRMAPGKIKEMLKWLTDCMISVSHSSVGEKPQLPPIKGWADLIK